MDKELNEIYRNMNQLRDYANLRDLVDIRKYGEALTQLKNSALNASTKEQLQKALESNDAYIIERTFDELNAKIMQALCWNC